MKLLQHHIAELNDLTLASDTLPTEDFTGVTQDTDHYEDHEDHSGHDDHKNGLK